MAATMPAVTRDLPVLVVGLARTGVAAVRFLAGAGARVRAADRRSAAELDAVVRELAPIAELVLGADDPGGARGHRARRAARACRRTVPCLATAVARGIPIVSEIELAARHLDVPILAVTGTNGKSTTTTLLGAMAARRRPPDLRRGQSRDAARERDRRRRQVAVVEVSSFQLEWVDRFRPKVGVFLNLTEDHLDRYPDLEAYGCAKLRSSRARRRATPRS